MSKKLSEIKNFLLDMDGTLYLGNRLFDSTPGFLNRIRESGRKLLFLTNNSSRSTSEYQQKLLGMGLQADEREIFTSAAATIVYLKNNTDYRRLFLLAVPSVEMIRTATGGKIPKVIGKPNREMIDSALAKLGARTDETAIVGDRVYTDMEMGYRAGLTTVLVLSGETKKENLIHLIRQPDYVVESVGDLMNRLV